MSLCSASLTDETDRFFGGFFPAFCPFRLADHVFFQGRNILLIGLGLVRGQILQNLRGTCEIGLIASIFQRQKIRLPIPDHLFPERLPDFRVRRMDPMVGIIQGRARRSRAHVHLILGMDIDEDGPGIGIYGFLCPEADGIAKESIFPP